MQKQTELGRLEKVELRNVWLNEAHNFTPWMAEPDNLALLGEAVGLDLELVDRERSVGPFSADILCRETTSGHYVLVENQLEKTDHTHLGQVITYAAGLNAVTIIWVAAEIREEHRSAIDWLNEISGTDFNFFGLEIELWRIGGSATAPKFNVVSKPNDWSRMVTAIAAKGLTETQQLQLDFWTRFKDFVESHDSRLRPTKPLPSTWTNFAIGRSSISISAVVSTWSSENESWDTGELRAVLYLGHDRAKDAFDLLIEDKLQIESEFGEPLLWDKQDDRKSCQVFVRRQFDLTNGESWPEGQLWLFEKLSKLHSIFVDRVKQLP